MRFGHRNILKKLMAINIFGVWGTTVINPPSSVVQDICSFCVLMLQLVRKLAKLLIQQGEYDEALKVGDEVRSKLDLAFSFEASDRLRELDMIMQE